MNNKKLLLLTIFCGLLLIGGKCPPPENKNVYVVLDRNSQNIKFTSAHKSFEERTGYVYTYVLKTDVLRFKNQLRVGFVYFGKIVPDMYKHEDIKKSRTFLDSIPYYDEKYIMEAKSIYDNELRHNVLEKSRVFVIDLGTLKNDSVMMYEVTVSFDGFKQ